MSSQIVTNVASNLLAQCLSEEFLGGYSSKQSSNMCLCMYLYFLEILLCGGRNHWHDNILGLLQLPTATSSLISYATSVPGDDAIAMYVSYVVAHFSHTEPRLFVHETA